MPEFDPGTNKHDRRWDQRNAGEHAQEGGPPRWDGDQNKRPEEELGEPVEQHEAEGYELEETQLVNPQPQEPREPSEIHDIAEAAQVELGASAESRSEKLERMDRKVDRFFEIEREHPLEQEPKQPIEQDRPRGLEP